MTNPDSPPQARSRLDGEDLRAMFTVATRLFESNIEAVNVLNVFPVPDGDTGTNMFLTLQDMMRATEAVRDSSAGEFASAMARGALMGARGNSGVILSQFFKGIAQELHDKSDFGSGELASALRSAREYSYRAVGEPVEGTMLTVISSVADAAARSADSGATLQGLLDAVCQAAEETVALTPTMLPVLRDAGVVDAGGFGLSIILEGVRLYVAGEESDLAEIQPPEPVGVEATGRVVSQQFLEATDEELYGYCTQFLIEGEDLDLEGVRGRLITMARSTVVVGDGTLLNVHVHVDDPGPIVSYAVSMGRLTHVKIESMDEQHREYSVARRREAAAVSVVAVAWGSGLETVFSGLGASGILPAGDTMNPSINEIIAAIDNAPSDLVIFLPNNKNIVPAARQAVEMAAKSMSVVPSTTIPQGIAAMLAFNPEVDLKENISKMEQKLSSVRTGEICRAVRPVELGGVSVKEGQIIGLLERKLVAASDEPTETLVSLLKEAGVFDGAVVTLYSGQEMPDEEANSALKRVQTDFPGADEVQLVAGGQPHYHYIISIE
ncbi:MAG: DAK2 domain-containing protein [SAR202 cluster bacterium]|jgi:hypothetical protein|nr:DAK2 domain-containing protein [SAR202 cluster bacterium]